MGTFLRETCLQECPQMFTGPVGPVEVVFYWTEGIFVSFYWPGVCCSHRALNVDGLSGRSDEGLFLA